jgi:hypothetical protein
MGNRLIQAADAYDVVTDHPHLGVHQNGNQVLFVGFVAGIVGDHLLPQIKGGLR